MRTAFAGRVRDELDRIGLSYGEASRRIGMSRNAVAMIENPRYDTLVKLVTVLGMDPRALTPELFQPPPPPPRRRPDRRVKEQDQVPSATPSGPYDQGYGEFG